MPVLGKPGAAVPPPFFFFNDTATTEIYTLSLHDALPICRTRVADVDAVLALWQLHLGQRRAGRSEEHTSELQSPDHLVFRLLLEKKNKLELAPGDLPAQQRDCIGTHALTTPPYTAAYPAT